MEAKQDEPFPPGFVERDKGVSTMPSRTKILGYGLLGFLIGFPAPVLAYNMLV